LTSANRQELKLQEYSTTELLDNVHSEMLSTCEEHLRLSDKNFMYVFKKGFNSTNGCMTDALEGISRLLPVLACLSVSRRTSEENKQILLKVIETSLLSGTKESFLSWGKTFNLDQKIVEASDIALAIWITKNEVWNKLDACQRKQIYSWLKQFLEVKSNDNNWLLFKLQINVILNQLVKGFGDLEPIKINEEIIKRVQQWHIGGGWFKDGPNGAVDYYTAWGFCYSFFWISLIDKKFNFLKKYITLLNENYIYLFGNQGPQIWGRSVCYKHAVLVPIISEAICNESKEINMRSFEIILDSFGRGDRMYLQGFNKKNPELLDSYSGPNSCLWALRPFIQLLYLDSRNANLHKRFVSNLFPVEIESFVVKPNDTLKIIGNHKSGIVKVINSNCVDKKEEKTKSIPHKLISLFLPFERKSKHPYYSQVEFSSDNDILTK
jgi:hypothetical protein